MIFIYKPKEGIQAPPGDFIQLPGGFLGSNNKVDHPALHFVDHRHGVLSMGKGGINRKDPEAAKIAAHIESGWYDEVISESESDPYCGYSDFQFATDDHYDLYPEDSRSDFCSACWGSAGIAGLLMMGMSLFTDGGLSGMLGIESGCDGGGFLGGLFGGGESPGDGGGGFFSGLFGSPSDVAVADVAAESGTNGGFFSGLWADLFGSTPETAANAATESVGTSGGLSTFGTEACADGSCATNAVAGASVMAMEDQ